MVGRRTIEHSRARGKRRVIPIACAETPSTQCNHDVACNLKPFSSEPGYAYR
jgi:hypothetical protein